MKEEWENHGNNFYLPLEKNGELGRDNKSLLFLNLLQLSIMCRECALYNPPIERTPLSTTCGSTELCSKPWEPLVVPSLKCSCVIDIFNTYTFKSSKFYHYWFDIRHCKRSLGEMKILSFNKVFNSLSLYFVYLQLFYKPFQTFIYLPIMKKTKNPIYSFIFNGNSLKSLKICF